MRNMMTVTLRSLGGLLVFLLLLGIVNVLFDFVVVDFLNAHLGTIIALAVLFYLGELFSLFVFPFNILFPFFSALGGVFLVGFVFEIFYFIGRLLEEPAFFVFQFLEPVVMILVFILAIIIGIVKIVIGLVPKKKAKKEKPKKSKKKSPSWEEIGDEFRQALFNLGELLKNAFKKW